MDRSYIEAQTSRTDKAKTARTDEAKTARTDEAQNARTNEAQNARTDVTLTYSWSIWWICIEKLYASSIQSLYNYTTTDN